MFSVWLIASFCGVKFYYFICMLVQLAGICVCVMQCISLWMHINIKLASISLRFQPVGSNGFTSGS